MGISYETGPWGFSVTYFHGENVGNGDGTKDFTLDADTGDIDGPTFVAETGDEEIDQILIGLKYKLAKGVVFNAYGAYVNFEDADGGITKEDVEAFVIGTAIRLDF